MRGRASSEYSANAAAVTPIALCCVRNKRHVVAVICQSGGEGHMLCSRQRTRLGSELSDCAIREEGLTTFHCALLSAHAELIGREPKSSCRIIAAHKRVEVSDNELEYFKSLSVFAYF